MLSNIFFMRKLIFNDGGLSELISFDSAKLRTLANQNN
jgi:hypothetical protein